MNLPAQYDLQSALLTLSSLPEQHGEVLAELLKGFSCSS